MLARVALLLFLAHKSAPVRWPPQLAQSTRSGCDVTEYAGAEPKDLWWHTRIWIDLPGGRWQYLFSIRPGSERAKALRDCDLFLRMYHEEILRIRKAPPTSSGSTSDPTR